jgi:hypothetical protein
VKEGFPIEIGLTRTPREGDATFLTTEEPAQEEEEPPPEESSEDEDSDDPDVIARRDEENKDEDALSDGDHAEALKVMKSLDVMAQNQRLAIVEIEAALPGFPDKLFGNFLLEQFKSLDVNSDGEIELKELAECCRRWRKIRRDKERSLERKEAKRLRREARWKQALEEQVKPEYRFGLARCGKSRHRRDTHWLISTQVQMRPRTNPTKTTRGRTGPGTSPWAPSFLLEQSICPSERAEVGTGSGRTRKNRRSLRDRSAD